MRFASRFLGALAVVASAAIAQAVPVVYTIDSPTSFLTIQIPGLTIPQNAGSDTTTLFGTLNANLTGTPTLGTIELTGGGDVQFNLQPLDPAPGPFGAAGTAPAQYGLFVNLAPFASGPAALRDAVAEATSVLPIAVAGGVFDAAEVNMEILSANLDFDIAGTLLTEADRAVLSNQGGANGPGVGTLSLVGLIETLFIPVNVAIPFDDLGLPLTIEVTGQITATRVIPEPGTIVMLGVGMIGLVAVGRRRFRRA